MQAPHREHAQWTCAETPDLNAGGFDAHPSNYDFRWFNLRMLFENVLPVEFRDSHAKTAAFQLYIQIRTVQ
jgi:hypothetical protein